MKINYKTTTKILLCVVAYDTAASLYNMYVVHPRNKKRMKRLAESRNDFVTISHLLAQKLDANGISLDTFDEIIIDEIAHKK